MCSVTRTQWYAAVQSQLRWQEARQQRACTALLASITMHVWHTHTLLVYACSPNGGGRKHIGREHAPHCWQWSCLPRPACPPRSPTLLGSRAWRARTCDPRLLVGNTSVTGGATVPYFFEGAQQKSVIIYVNCSERRSAPRERLINRCNYFLHHAHSATPAHESHKCVPDAAPCRAQQLVCGNCPCCGVHIQRPSFKLGNSILYIAFCKLMKDSRTTPMQEGLRKRGHGLVVRGNALRAGQELAEKL